MYIFNKDKEYPSGLNEAVKNIPAEDLAKMLSSNLKHIQELKEYFETNIRDLKQMGNRTISGDIDGLLNIEKEISNLINKFTNLLMDLKGQR